MYFAQCTGFPTDCDVGIFVFTSATHSASSPALLPLSLSLPLWPQIRGTQAGTQPVSEKGGRAGGTQVRRQAKGFLMSAF